MNDVVLVLLAVTAGFTVSGIISNLYRLFVKSEKTPLTKTIYMIVMVVAGPSVLFEKAAHAWREKSSSGMAFWLVAAICGYWSLALGLIVIQIAISL